MHPSWLTLDIVPVVAGLLDFKSYVRLLSTCKLTKKCLSPNKSTVVYPHAIHSIKKRIEEMRVATEDPEFAYERTIGNVLVFAAPINRGQQFKSYYHIRSDEWDPTVVATVTIIVNHTLQTPRFVGGGVNCRELDTVRARVIPSFQNPMSSGKIVIKTLKPNRLGIKVVVASRTVVYTNGFREILHELACNMCPLKH